MIQVLARAFRVVDLLKEFHSLSLKDIADKLEVRTNTAWNILDSLLELGIIIKIDAGKYALDNSYFTLNGKGTPCLEDLAAKYVGMLAEQTGETIVLTKYIDDEMAVIAEKESNRSVVVNRDSYRTGSVYSWAAGHLVLAFFNQKQLQDYIDKHGMPGEEWPAVSDSRELLESELQTMRDEQIAYRINKSVQSVAVPILNTRGHLTAVMSICLPVQRFKGRVKTQILKQLCSAGKMMSQELV